MNQSDDDCGRRRIENSPVADSIYNCATMYSYNRYLPTLFFAPTKVLIDIRLQCGGFNARKHFLSFSNAGQMSPAARSRIDDWEVKLLGGDNHRVYARFFGKKKKKKKSLCGCCWFSKTSQQRASPRRPFLTVTSPAYSDVTLLRAGTFLWCENESAYTRPIIL